MSSFHEVLFPPEISYGSSGGPKFKTTIFSADSGYEQRNRDWSKDRAEYDVSHGIKNPEQMEELNAFFRARAGRAFGFRFKDHADYRIKQQVIGVGDGTTKSFQIIKTYKSGVDPDGNPFVYQRKIAKIAWGTVSGVMVGVAVKTAPNDYEVDENTGVITFFQAPPAGAEVKIGAAEFHVPVRFDTDHLDAQHEFWNTQSWNSIPLVEVRDWSELFA